MSDSSSASGGRQDVSDAVGTPSARPGAGRKERVGIVVSDAADKTIVVTVDRRTTHGLYAKTLTRTKKYHVHDERNESGVGDRVRIVETRPLSKTKRWRLGEILERAR